MKHPSRPFLVFTLTFIGGSLIAAWLLVTLPSLFQRLTSSPYFAPDTAAVVSFALKFLGVLTVGFLAALFATRRIGRIGATSTGRQRFRPLEVLARALEALLLFSYVGTWVFGVPAVVSHLDNEVIANYKAVVAHAPPPHFPKRHPYPQVSTPLAFPVAPGFILSYHAYMVAPLYGAGLIQVHFWCGLVPEPVVVIPLWFS